MQYRSSKKSNEKAWNHTKKTLRYQKQKEEQVKEYLEKIADINKENIVYCIVNMLILKEERRFGSE